MAITGYWAEFSVLYSRSLLVICFIYSSVYMSTPISQFIPPPHLPPVTVSLFCISVPLCFVDKFICAFSFLIKDSTYQFSSVQSLSCVHVFATLWIAACPAHYKLPELAQTSGAWSRDFTCKRSHLMFFSDWFHLVWQSVGSSMLLQMTLSWYLYWSLSEGGLFSLHSTSPSETYFWLLTSKIVR